MSNKNRLTVGTTEDKRLAVLGAYDYEINNDCMLEIAKTTDLHENTELIFKNRKYKNLEAFMNRPLHKPLTFHEHDLTILIKALQKPTRQLRKQALEILRNTEQSANIEKKEIHEQ